MDRMRELLRDNMYFFEYVQGFTSTPYHHAWTESKITVHLDSKFNSPNKVYIVCEVGTFGYNDGPLSIYGEPLLQTYGVESFDFKTPEELLEIISGINRKFK